MSQRNSSVQIENATLMQVPKAFCKNFLVTLTIDREKGILILWILYEHNDLLEINMHIGELMLKAVDNWDDSRSG